MFWLNTILLIFVFIGNSSLAAGQHESLPYELDPIIVTGSRIPDHLSDIANSVSVTSREEIEKLPADNIADILKYINSVEVKQRGARGVQADVGIRGGSYEQTLIMLDGVVMNDPQTGHHNMDLPVTMNDIKRIEVVKGPAASTYGPNAMGGVINIITRMPDKSFIGGHSEFGEYGYFKLGAHTALSRNKTSSLLSASRRYSSGYLGGKDTDFDIITINYKGLFKNESNTFRLGLGYCDKDFGAYKFYSDIFPKQREQTKTFLAYGNAELEIAEMKIKPNTYWRHHKDKYKINIDGSWNINDHRTDILGTKLNAILMSGLGKTSIGADAEFKHIESSNLGDHDHTRQSLLIEHRIYPIDQISLGIGSSLVHYSRWGWEYWPGADINIDLTDNLTWYATFEKSFRVPTYTELYYFTAANQGNPSLKPEKAWTGETGLKWLSQGISSSLSLFYRDLEDAVTWLRQPEQTAWQAKNIATIQTKGGEVSFTIYPGFFLETELFSSACFAYTYLESNRSIPGTMESKYVLDYLRHQLTGSLTITWFPALEQVIKTRYGERIVGDNYTVVDSRLTYSFSDFQIFCQANNLFNEDYIESGFAPMPDCWITVGIKFNWD